MGGKFIGLSKESKMRRIRFFGFMRIYTIGIVKTGFVEIWEHIMLKHISDRKDVFLVFPSSSSYPLHKSLNMVQ